MTNTPTASAASRTPAISASFGRNSWLAVLAIDDQQDRRQHEADGGTIRPNTTTLPSTMRSGRHLNRGIGGPALARRARAPGWRRARSAGCRGCAGSSRDPCARRCRACTSSSMHDRRDAEGDEQHARPEILGVADRHHPSLRSVTTLKLAIVRTGCRSAARRIASRKRAQAKKGQAGFACPSIATRRRI